MNMKKIFLLIFSVLFTVNIAHSEQWLNLSEDSKLTVLLDTDSIEKTENLYKYKGIVKFYPDGEDVYIYNISDCEKNIAETYYYSNYSQDKPKTTPDFPVHKTALEKSLPLHNYICRAHLSADDSDTSRQEAESLNTYVNTLSSILHEKWRALPNVDRRNNIQTKVLLRLDKQGNLICSAIVKTFKNTDNSPVLSLINNFFPYKPFPVNADSKLKSLDIELTFEQELLHFFSRSGNLDSSYAPYYERYEYFKNVRKEKNQAGHITNKRTKYVVGEDGKVEILNLD